MIISREQEVEIMRNLVDDGLRYCNRCKSFFVVRNTCDGEINELVCPCCGVYSEDAIEIVEVDE